MGTAVDRMLSRLDYPMFVVTTADRTGDERAGCLVGFATQCSIDPLRFLVCLSVSNRTYRVARQAELLAVHLIGEGQRELAELFASTTGDDIDKFRRCAWHPGPGGVPLLTEASGWFVCAILNQYDLGDHVGFLLQPVASESRDDESRDDQPPLMFSSIRDVTPGHPA